MMERVITAIKVQKRNPQRVSIDLDGEYAFGLSRLVAAWLNIGDHLSDEKVKSLLERDTFEVVYQRSLDLINHRPRSEKEIRQRLGEKNYSAEQIDQVVEKLKLAGLIRDEDFARMWIDSRKEFHPRSKSLIRFELKNKGIAEEQIDAALKELPAEQELAYHAASQYVRRLHGVDWQTFRKRLGGYLARRGFSYGTVAPLVKELWQQQINLLDQSNHDNEEFEK